MEKTKMKGKQQLKKKVHPFSLNIGRVNKDGTYQFEKKPFDSKSDVLAAARAVIDKGDKFVRELVIVCRNVE